MGDFFLPQMDDFLQTVCALITARRGKGSARRIDREALADKLGDSDFLCVVVDGRMMLRQDFIEALSSDA
jgi:hypothetical protein